MIRPDDWQVTAYALGELSERERVDVETAAAADPAVRAALDEATAAAGVLTAALRTELVADAGPALDSAQRAAILERAATGAPVLSLTSRLRRWGLFAATAAAVMVGALIWTSQSAPITKISDITRVRRGDGRDVYLSPSNYTPPRPPSLPEDARPTGVEDGCLQAPRPNGPAAKAPAASVPITALRNRISVDRVEPIPRLSGLQVARVEDRGGGGQGLIPIDATVPGQPPRVNDEIFFGTPANPRGVPFGQANGGLVPADRVNDEEHPLFGAEGEESIRPSGTESYRSYVENAFLRAKAEPLSTFSIDVDTASYSNVRRMVGEGHLPPADAVRLEELVNYFPYAYAAPTGADPFAVNLEVASCPWNAKHRLVRVGIKGKDVARKERPASNLVFLLDVSGSMDAPNKLPLVKASIRMLLEELNERDTVAIVTYAGESGLALPPTSCEKKNTILEAVDKLVASGSTNGASGITLAYDKAVASFIPGGVNRVVLCTDGDFNVGVTSHDELLKLIEAKAKSKVFLTALGFGMGNYKDDTLELLADKGNGNYGYVDSTREARKVLVDGASGTLVTIAKDVKVQVEFNPATVASYRLVGYDNRLLAAKDFNDDTKDAGEIGAGHTVTAFYEVVPVGVDEPAPEVRADVEPLRYGQPPPPAPVPPAPPAVPTSASAMTDSTTRELLTVKLRFKAPEGDVSTKREFPLTDAGASFDKASADFQFASAVAAFALILKQSPYAGTANLDTVLELAGSSLGNDPGGWRAEFVDLVKKAKSLSGAK